MQGRVPNAYAKNATNNKGEMDLELSLTVTATVNSHTCRDNVLSTRIGVCRDKVHTVGSNHFNFVAANK